MAEYINRTRLLAEILDAKLKNKKRASLNILSWFENLVQKQPVADVVKVVRCKDCKHATFYSCKNDACYKAIICEYEIGIGDENFYCACAEPRTPKERSNT